MPPRITSREMREGVASPDRIVQIRQNRLLSLRAYDARGMMAWAEAVPGSEIESAIAQLFAIERVAYLHVHYAKPGCYACRVERA